MTAGERLRALAGIGGTAAALLLSIGAGATTGAALVDYSGLQTGTAAEHLLAEHQERRDDTASAHRRFYLTGTSDVHVEHSPDRGSNEATLTPEIIFGKGAERVKETRHSGAGAKVTKHKAGAGEDYVFVRETSGQDEKGNKSKALSIEQQMVIIMLLDEM